MCLIVVMSHDEDDICMTCAALEMIFRRSASYIHSAFDKVAASLIPRLLQSLIISEKKNVEIPRQNNFEHYKNIDILFENSRATKFFGRFCWDDGSACSSFDSTTDATFSNM